MRIGALLIVLATASGCEKTDPQSSGDDFEGHFSGHSSAEDSGVMGNADGAVGDPVDGDADGYTSDIDCDDNNPCTDDVCIGIEGCSSVANNAPCDDDEVLSCTGRTCIPKDWISDDFCDAPLDCPATEYDGGDCLAKDTGDTGHSGDDDADEADETEDEDDMSELEEEEYEYNI